MSVYTHISRRHVMTSAAGDDEIVFAGWTGGWRRESGVRVTASLGGRSFEGHLEEPAARQLWTLLKESGFRQSIRLANSDALPVQSLDPT